ncbi:MAG TPA: hypothetical protein VFC25_06630 [Verrucomicrobiae bacterium]|nr:hypothetical protein [Verrucomicrobiae bacterium]
MTLVLPFLKPPSVVIVYLQNPRERYWGVVKALDATGLVLRGTDLNSFDDWVRQAGAGEAHEASTLFFPLARIEKVLVDAPAGPAPSLQQQFETRVGRPLLTFLEDEAP